MTIVAIILTIVAVAAAIGGQSRYPLLTLHALGMGAIMLSVLTVPNFPHFTAASLGFGLMFVVIVAAVWMRIRRSAPLGQRHKSAVAVALFDVGFMSVATILMPAHGSAWTLAAHPLGAVGGDGAHAIVSGGPMVWLVLITWGLCAAVLTVPAIRRRSHEDMLHLVCSVCMIAAMAAMAV